MCFPFQCTAFYPIPGITSIKVAEPGAIELQHALVAAIRAQAKQRGADTETMRTKPRALRNRLPISSIVWHCVTEACLKTAHRKA
jgi:hypothetical protein